MTVLRRIRSVSLQALALLLLLPVCGSTSGRSALIVKKIAKIDVSVCAAASLPSILQKQLEEKFGSWKIQELTGLNDLARQSWQAAFPHTCPGIAVGKFERADALSYAFLLVPREHPQRGYKFIVFTPTPKHSNYQLMVLEGSSEVTGVSSYIHEMPITTFFDKESRERFQIGTGAKDCILFVTTGENAHGKLNEYEADVYFWSITGYQHQPVDY